MKEILILRWHGTCRRRYAPIVRMSILLLQLLCLAQCHVALPAASASGEETVVEHTADTSLEHHNLRDPHSSSSYMENLTSFTDALYALLGSIGSYLEPVTKDRHDEAGASSDTKAIQFLDDIRGGKSEDWADSNGFDIDRRLAKRGASRSRTVDMKWYVDWINAECVQSCDPRTTTNPNCAGLAMRENFLFDSASQCCKTMIPWKSYDTCTRMGSPDGTLNQVYQDLNKPVNKPVAPIKQQIAPKASCWRSGMSCASEAQKFACCGVCSNGVCI